MSGVRRTAAAAPLLLLALAACGSADDVRDFPPPAVPAVSPPPSPPAGRPFTGPAVFWRDDPTAGVRVDRRRRELVVGREREPAGVAPANAVRFEDRVYVTDRGGEALLVFRTEPELRLVHRVAALGAPWALAVDARRRRIWVTLTARNRVLGYSAEERPDRLQGFATVRQPNRVVVDLRDDVVVLGAERSQRIDPDRD